MLDVIEELMHKGVELHKSGKVEVAAQLYSVVLKEHPEHPDANHNMGVLAVGIGKIPEALRFFETALEANADVAQFWVSYIDALIGAGRMGDAQAVLDQAKSNGARGEGFDQLEARLNVSAQGQLMTCSAASEAHPQKPNILDSLKLDQAIRLAKKKSKEDTGEEAKRIYQDILIKFPKNKRAMEGLKALVGTRVGKASKVQDPPQEQQQLLISLYNERQFIQVLEQITVLLEMFPNSSFLHNISGAVYKGLGHLDTSIEAYKKALAINPDHSEAYYNMGVAFEDQGKLKEAIDVYKKVLTLDPYYVQAHFSMGNALKDQCQLADAIQAYTKAITLKPDYTEALNNMSVALQQITFKKPIPGLQNIITLLLDRESHVRASSIAVAVISLLKLEPQLKHHLQNSSVERVGLPLQDLVSDLSRLSLLLKLMSVCPLYDLELENLFRNLRSSLLLTISDNLSSPDMLRLQSALALQCFTNEYIYNQSEDEETALAQFDGSVKQVFNNGGQPSSQTILCLASYKPLSHYDWCGSLQISDEIKDVFTRQVSEPSDEAKIKTVLPVLEEITDIVSCKVREQYEASPYPRWVNSELRLASVPISHLVEETRLKLFDDKIKEAQSPKILIAGCGTGQHSIATGAMFKGSKVLAIDLSLSSLSYAKRKTEELGIKNIDYMQADILNIGKLNRQFDIVESVGVLHHTHNPLAGWKVLTDCLKLGGLMKIGLYSELARQDVVKIRQEINEEGIGSSEAEMRLFRSKIVNSDQNHHKRILAFRDFYSLSELRDLLFHVQEHRFTIPQIQNCLSELGLKFCGFGTNKIVSHFMLSNTGMDDLYDLDKWQTHEEANPNLFAGMYEFWCQKVA
jgi:tetratricopeptide (TPR) repeat protein/SAM-dependent methyltransferase